NQVSTDLDLAREPGEDCIDLWVLDPDESPRRAPLLDHDDRTRGQVAQALEAARKDHARQAELEEKRNHPINGADQVAQNGLGAADRYAALRDDAQAQAVLSQRLAVEHAFTESTVAPGQEEERDERRSHSGSRSERHDQREQNYGQDQHDQERLVNQVGSE